MDHRGIAKLAVECFGCLLYWILFHLCPLSAFAVVSTIRAARYHGFDS